MLTLGKPVLHLVTRIRRRVDLWHWDCVVCRNAIRLLKEERHNLEVKLKVTNFNKSVKEHEKYKAKFAELVRDAKRAKFEFNRERKIEMEIDKEILRLEMGIHDPKNRIQTTEKSKIMFGVNTLCSSENKTPFQFSFILLLQCISVYLLTCHRIWMSNTTSWSMSKTN